ncbi:Protein of unknown function [Bacillus cereus]|nr:Protein of unknown function [Bacillus cereus]
MLMLEEKKVIGTKKIVHEDLFHCIKITKVNVKKWVDNKIGIV